MNGNSRSEKSNKKLGTILCPEHINWIEVTKKLKSLIYTKTFTVLQDGRRLKAKVTQSMLTELKLDYSIYLGRTKLK